jgi:hypothetical protein
VQVQNQREFFLVNEQILAVNHAQLMPAADHPLRWKHDAATKYQRRSKVEIEALRATASHLQTTIII